jgi:hypothetical protein
MTNSVERKRLFFFKKDSTKTRFFENQIINLRYANKMLDTDFAGMVYDPNFDAGHEGFFNYLETFTGSKEEDFSEEQVEVIKDVFSL